MHGQHPSACPLTHPETPWYIFQNHVHVPPQVCGICKPKRFPVFPRKRSDLLQMLLYRLLMSLRIFRFCVVLHRCLLRSRLHQFYDIRCMHPGQHILYFGTLNDRHFSIPCAKPKRLCSSQTGDPRSMRGRGSKRVLLAISSEHFGSIGEKPSCFKVFRLFYGRKFSKNSMDQWPLCRGSNRI